ncbi:MAG TPA: DUF4097 family beta strand repeat-containing protein [Chryseosolibacter sp.]|nr:DUF4097 family beta strand repeat-containing protein [Chryseosolibacter sp.]
MKNLVFALFVLSFVSVAFGQDGEFHLDKTYRIGKSNTIDLSCSDAKVFVTGSTRSDVHVKIDRKVTAKGWTSGMDDFRVEVTEENGNIRIREYQKDVNVTFGYYEEDYRIEIEAPEGIAFLMRGDDGDVFVKNINGAISLSLDDADAELTGCKGHEFLFRFDDGDLRMDQGKGSLEIDADDADIEIYGAEFSRIDAEIDDGDLIIETSLSSAGDYRFNSQDGLISLKVTAGGGQFDIHHDDANVTVQGRYKTIEESEDRTRLELPNGNARVTVRADDARVKLSTN